MIEVYHSKDLKEKFRGDHALIISKKDDWYKVFLSKETDEGKFSGAERVYFGIDPRFAKDIILDVYLLRKDDSGKHLKQRGNILDDLDSLVLKETEDAVLKKVDKVIIPISLWWL